MKARISLGSAMSGAASFTTSREPVRASGSVRAATIQPLPRADRVKAAMIAPLSPKRNHPATMPPIQRAFLPGGRTPAGCREMSTTAQTINASEAMQREELGKIDAFGRGRLDTHPG